MFSFFKKKEVKEEKPKNLKLIALCLAFEVANADNDIDVRERDLILEKIKESIDVTVLTEKEIFDVIKEESQKRVSFYDIIHDINKNLDKKEKIDVLKMLWESLDSNHKDHRVLALAFGPGLTMESMLLRLV